MDIIGTYFHHEIYIYFIPLCVVFGASMISWGYGTALLQKYTGEC